MPVEYFHCTRFNFPQISVVSLTDREPLVPDGTGLEAGGRSTTPVLVLPMQLGRLNFQYIVTIKAQVYGIF